ncbi:MAG TPA: peptidylprolyl isomerase [Thermoanaerobaculia bacterium]|nr:peptidylprolyl isomerase [Thermoanaerobaculia bacterium]HUM28632.1 peptidylprolyl isomerase [Thermoanaerobaculia bacterium]HXK66760.1 peptidylprolyl isomerase [Thermoanaerobaculia bacterium]
MSKVKSGDTVKVHFTGKLSDGSIFDSSQEEGPLEFTIGEETLIPAFEQALIGMKPGESKTITIACEDAYGPRDEELVFEVDRSEIPGDEVPKVGEELELVPDGVSEEEEDDEAIPCLIIDVNDEVVVLDANHPLADEDLTFEIELIEIL